MTRLYSQLEEERRRLNELGGKSLEQRIPLFKNEAVQAQSRKVDELVVQLNRKKTGREHNLR